MVVAASLSLFFIVIEKTSCVMSGGVNGQSTIRRFVVMAMANGAAVQNMLCLERHF